MKKTKVVMVAGLDLGAIKAKIQHASAFFKTGLNTATQKIKNFKSGLEESGKKSLFIFSLLAISSLSASAQKTAVLDALSKHGIDAGVLNPDSFQQPDDFCYDLRQTTIAAGKEKVIEAKFNPASPKDEQWTVVSIDGKSPSKGDINSFRKDQNKPAASNKTDESSYRVEKDAADYLVISNKLDPASIGKDAPFMKDCRSYITINLRTKRVEQVQVLNEKPVKIKILNVEKLDIITKYKWNDEANRYFAANQNLNIQGKFLGQAVPVQTISEYSNYAKK